jgi:sensor histidine kinase YesM
MTALSISNQANKKNIVNLFFLILFACILILLTPNFHSYYERGIRNSTYMFLTSIALFFIQNIVLIPIKLEENNARNFFWFSLACLVTFFSAQTFFFFDTFNKLDSFSGKFLGIDTNNLMSLNSLIKTVAIIFIPLLVVSIFSLIYSLIIYGFNLISPYLEAFVHIVVLTMLFVLIVIVPDIKARDISLLLSLVLFFYLNTFILTPIALRYKKITIYLFGLFTLVLGFFLFQTILLEIFGFPQFNPETGDRYNRKDLFGIIFNAPGIILLVITLVLSIVYGYVRIRIKTQERFFNTKLGKKHSELELLKSQVNPHFLFNTLNSLYATALSEDAKKTSTSIAKLASLLRYMQKDINKDFIPLENEIRYLQDYIAIQKLRCAVEPHVETTFTNLEKQMISPGLFIPFVENAFKYGIDPSNPSELIVSLIASGENIYFSCVNSYNDEYKSFYKEQGLGIGIKNAKQRLELVYPKNHTFEITKKDNQFSVKISIPIQFEN